MLYYTGLERLARDEHSSLLGPSISNEGTQHNQVISSKRDSDNTKDCDTQHNNK